MDAQRLLAPRPAGSTPAKDPDESDESTIAFVNCTDPAARRTAATRRLIHKHAMKEIGKSRRRVRPPKVVELDTSVLDRSQQERRPVSWWLGVRWTGVSGGAVDPLLRYPVQISAPARELVANVFREDGGQRPLRDAWFTVGLQDEAAFFIILANSALHRNALQRKAPWGLETDESIHYSAKAMESIRRRLDLPVSDVIDGIIGAISGLLANADLRGDWNDWLTHHNGMLSLIRQRGGIDKLEANEALRITVSWCELRGALMLNMQPSFPLPRQWSQYTQAPALSKSSQIRMRLASSLWSRTTVDSLHWITVFSELISFSEATFSATDLVDNSAECGAWTSPMIHKFLSWRPALAHHIPDQAMLEACRLGALLFLVRAWRFFGVRPVMSGFLVSSLKFTLTTCGADWGAIESFQIWVLYLGAIEARGKAEELWFQEQMRTALSRAGRTSDDVLDCLKEILWFECLFKADHDDLLQALYQ